MNEQDLINIWNEQDSTLEKSIAVNQQLLKTVTLEKVKSMLTIFRRTQFFELIVNFLFLLWLIKFIRNDVDSTVLVISSSILFALMFGGIIVNIYNLYLAKSITFDMSIVDAQRKIEQMKMSEKRSVNALYIIIPLVPIPFLLVFAKAFVGIDLYEIFDKTYLLSFTLGSFLIGLIVVWLVKKFPNEEMEKAISFLNDIQKYKR